MRYRGAYRFVRVNVLLWWWEWQKLTVAKIFSRQATANPEKIAFIFEDKEWTYKEVSWINYRCAARGDLNPLWFAPQLEEYSNRIGRYFAGKSLSREDSVGLIMESRPEYVGIWLGLSKAGLVGALLNTNLRQDVLVHSIKAANCKAVIFGSNFKDGKLMNLGKKVSELFKGVGSTDSNFLFSAIAEIRERIPNVALYQWSELPDTSCLEGAIDLNPEISSVDSGPLDTVALGTPRDKLIYIYTSGTTGMPKAAVITNLRYHFLIFPLFVFRTHRSTSFTIFSNDEKST